ncbi:hypothetical protein O0I10_006433 [Lichtheimia ornata]|uniref:Uncharacterized protein n=1 Tax=Lichtheimia ornata TaxID=688661 RepID=A0AAD7XX98_9FUNG|nr:uncharacterized protein O0I10_006433 [Lichtheimia ornata]KAJ8657905.1 hypothetical protein O0I10_006433 [Lichtheimia ornata]
MRQRSSTFLNGDRQSSCSEHDQTTTSRRRVSFDLSHNVVHILPTLEECRKEASRRGHEQWERKQLSQEMLNDMIIAEIQQECTRSMAEETSSEEEVQHQSLKSCLKRPPPPSSSTQASSPHHHSHKKNKKKSKRSTKRTSKHHGCNTEARGQSFLPSPNMAMC